jgi:hypothetical protein
MSYGAVRQKQIFLALGVRICGAGRRWSASIPILDCCPENFKLPRAALYTV